MPVPWLPEDFVGVAERMLRAKPPIVAPQTPAKAPAQVPEDGYLEATAKIFRSPSPDVYVYEGDVVAKYGPTTVYADYLEVNQKTQRAVAKGNVRVVDPEAELTAENLDFTWDPLKRSGTAQNVRARIGNVNITARQANITPTRYEFLDVTGTSCNQNPPLFELRTRRLVIIPGREGKAEKPNIYVYGKKLIGLPDRSFGLDPRTQGFQLPSISYRRDGKLGVAWSSGFFIDRQTNLSLGLQSFPGLRPSYGAVATRTFLPAEKLTDIITPGSEYGERFRNGYLENIRVSTPLNERRYYQSLRKSVSVASQMNFGVAGQDVGVNFSKPIEVVGEIGGPFRGGGDGGYLTQLRLQTIRRGVEPINARAIVINSAILPSVHLTPKLGTILRLDNAIYAGAQEPFGWVRGMVGLAYQPIPQLTMGAGVILAGEWGTPQFEGIDDLYAKDGYVWRMDLNLGPTKAGYMQKWDRRMGLYDREYYVSQVVGCLEPFVVYRKYPGEYNLGIRFRLDDFYDVLRRRDFQRTKPTTPPKTTYIPPEPVASNK